MPSDYAAGYARALAHDPALAATYIRHTGIGDPLAEAAAADCAALERAVVARWIEAGMRGADDPGLREAPASLRAFFRAAETPPAWLDPAAFGPGVRMFHRNSYTILVAFVTGVLIEGFTTNIAQSFMLTGRVRDRGVRRLGQNNRHMTEIFFPGGLERQGDGWEALGPHPADPRPAAPPPAGLAGVGRCRLGHAHQRRPPGLRHRRLLRPAAEAHADPGRVLQR